MSDDTLIQDIKEYSPTELEQLRQMTGEVLDHWTKMLKEHELKEGVKIAVKMSIKQAKEDIRIISEEISKRGKIE